MSDFARFLRKTYPDQSDNDSQQNQFVVIPVLYFVFASCHKFLILTRSLRTAKTYSVKQEPFEWRTDHGRDHMYKINNEIEKPFPTNTGDFSVKIIWNCIQVNYYFSCFRITVKATDPLQSFRLTFTLVLNKNGTILNSIFLFQSWENLWQYMDFLKSIEQLCLIE